MNDELEKILNKFAESAVKENMAYDSTMTVKQAKLAIQNLIARKQDKQLETFVSNLKVAIRADYQRLAEVVMRKEQFTFNEETFGYRTINQELKKLRNQQ